VRANPNVGIVDIYTTLGYENGAAAGTGMILSRTGEVLTNNHVIRSATSFRVVDVTTHKTYSANVVGYSVSRDVAVLQLVHATHLQTIRLGRTVRVRVGQTVVARGNAQGRGGAPKAARGRVTALHRHILARDETGDSETLSNVIATNAAVEPGDSGGPLEDGLNRAIGMVTAGSTAGIHRGFAIPIKQALFIARLYRERELERDRPRRTDGVPSAWCSRTSRAAPKSLRSCPMVRRTRPGSSPVTSSPR